MNEFNSQYGMNSLFNNADTFLILWYILFQKILGVFKRELKPLSRWHYRRWLTMGWLWLVGSIKLQVSFAKEPYKRDYILQKRPGILSILLTVATPPYAFTWTPPIGHWGWYHQEWSHYFQWLTAHSRWRHLWVTKGSATKNMGWLRLVGSLKLYVSFAEFHLFYRALLQKRR